MTSTSPAFGDVFARHESTIRGTLRRTLGADDEVPDLVNDVFVAAVRSVHRLRDPGAMKSWLLTITLNIARTAIQSRMRRRRCTLVAPDELADALVTAADVEGRQTLASLCEVVSHLPPKERAVFALRRIEKLTLPQVAAQCGVSLATAKRRLARAETRFELLARANPTLRDRLDQ